MSLFKPYLAVLSSLFSLISLDANAQQAASFPIPSSTNDVGTTAGDTQSGELDRIIVTGYIVPHIGDGPAPVTVLDNTYAQRRGATTVQSVLQSLPQNIGSFTPAVNAGWLKSSAPGISSVNLRGLGENNTLVLIDGQRQVPFPLAQNGTSNFVDISAVPLAAVDRIEIRFGWRFAPWSEKMDFDPRPSVNNRTVSTITFAWVEAGT